MNGLRADIKGRRFRPGMLSRMARAAWACARRGIYAFRGLKTETGGTQLWLRRGGAR